MKCLKNLKTFKLILLISFFIGTKTLADNHNIYETLENIRNDIKTLEKAYDSLVKDGLSEDHAAKEIADLVFKETGIDPDYGFDEEE